MLSTYCVIKDGGKSQFKALTSLMFLYLTEDYNPIDFIEYLLRSPLSLSIPDGVLLFK